MAMKRTSWIAFYLIIALCVPAFSQQKMSKEELARYVQQKYQETSELWKQKKIKEGVAILENLSSNPNIRDVEGAWVGIQYTLACGYSLLGENERALAALSEAIVAGFSDIGQILSDADLYHLRSDSRFASILANLKMTNYLWESPAFQSSYKDNLSDDEKIAGLSKLWSEIKYNFVYFDRVPTLDWDGLYFEYLPEVRKTRSTVEYYRVLQKMCAQLRDGHTSVNVPNELFLELYSRPAFQTHLVEKRVYIGKVLSESLKKSGIKPGIEILRIDGIPVHQYAKEFVAQYQSSSTSQGWDVGTYELYLLCGSPNKPVELELSDEKGATFKRTFQRDYRRLQNFTQPIEFRVLKDNIGYVVLNTFGDRDLVASFDSLFPTIEKTESLVLDLRENTGGNSDIGYDILGYFTNRPFRIVTGKTRVYKPFSRSMGRKQTWEAEPAIDWQPHGKKVYSKPVALLIGPQTGSAAEDFCATFRAMKRGPMIGTPTAGTTGQPLFFALPGGGKGVVCTVRTTYPDSKEFVGIGIQPDIYAPTTIDDIRAGRDSPLETALRELNGTTTWFCPLHIGLEK
jgi:C-terminal processing protease CtpA/Prc